VAGTTEIAQYSIFGAYDLAVAKWCRAVTEQVVEHSLPIVFASPQRAFAEAKKVVERNTTPGKGPTSGDNRMAKVPLPLISITRGGIEPRDGRIYPFKGAFRGWLPSTDSSQRLVYEARPPVPYFIDYQLDIWSKTVNVQSQLVTQFLGEFDPHRAYSIVKPHENWGTYWMPIVWGGLSDNSELEGGDSEDRVVRSSLNIRIEAWKFFGPTTQLTALTAEVRQDMVGVDIVRLVNKQYRAIFIQSKEGYWFKLYSTNKGLIDLLPVDPPQNVPKTSYFTNQLVALEGGVVLAETPTLHYKLNWAPNETAMAVNYAPVRDDTTEELLVIPKEANLLIGPSDGSSLYGQFRISSLGQPLLKERVIID
jgi:hypothetical protein